MIATVSGLFGIFCLIYATSDIVQHRRTVDRTDWLVDSFVAIGAAATVWTAVF
jgi:hypothetical protein